MLTIQFKIVLFWVWLVIGIVILLPLASPFILNGAQLNAITPKCESKTNFVVLLHWYLVLFV